ncbi:HK97 gp10 family phage protein [Helcococcus bovis]|uniref:HK97 gp10 family phage protein n=1 Tax=Helcococcus bovis TaxID=3153252 RepID=UPI0038B70BB4
MKELHKELKDIFEDYTDDVIKATNEIIDEISKETVKNLKSSGSFKDYRPKYRKSWRVSNGDKKLGIQSKIIHNKEYQLTHLLEHGHVNRDGSRTKAYPHIEKAEKKASEDIIKYFEGKV